MPSLAHGYEDVPVAPGDLTRLEATARLSPSEGACWMRTTTRAFFLAALGLLAGPAGPARAGIIYDLANDWSDAANPNGSWSYRESPTLVLSNHLADYDP